MSKPVSLVALAIAGVAMIGLGCSAGSDGSSTTTASPDSADSIGNRIGDTLASTLHVGEPIAADEADCVGSSLIDSLGRTDAAAAAASSNLTDLDPHQRRAASNAFDTCVKGSSVAPGLVAAFYRGLGSGTPNDEVIKCASDGVHGKVGVIAFESVDTASSPSAAPTKDARPTTLLTVFDNCVPPADIEDILAEGLTRSGIAQDVADCAAAAIGKQVPLREVALLGMTGAEVPADMQSRMTDAIASCGG